jgi:hypothetical protein
VTSRHLLVFVVCQLALDRSHESPAVTCERNMLFEMSILLFRKCARFLKDAEAHYVRDRQISINLHDEIWPFGKFLEFSHCSFRNAPLKPVIDVFQVVGTLFEEAILPNAIQERGLSCGELCKSLTEGRQNKRRAGCERLE